MQRFIEFHEIPQQAVLLDTRPKAQYLAGHLVGARHGEFLEKFILRNPEQLEFFDATLEAWVRGLGLSGNEHVVTYDAGRDTRASRAAWALEYAGFAVSVLRQGMAGLPLETDVPTIQASQFVLVPHREFLATAEQILAGGVVIVDTRDALEFAGQKLAPGASRGGHIAGAINLDWQNLADETGIKSSGELDGLLESLPKEKEIVVHCQSGARSSVVFHALRERGYTVKNYLGSMNEWASDESLPLVQE